MGNASLSDVDESVFRELSYLSPADVGSLIEIVRRLVAAYQPEKIYLFGSKGRGDAGSDSDLDLMVVVPDTSPAERQRS